MLVIMSETSVGTAAWAGIAPKDNKSINAVVFVCKIFMVINSVSCC
jgi:hypothetical protein